MKRTPRPAQTAGGPPGPVGAAAHPGWTFAGGAAVYTTPPRTRRNRSREQSLTEIQYRRRSTL